MVFVYEMNASISYSFSPLCIPKLTFSVFAASVSIAGDTCQANVEKHGQGRQSVTKDVEADKKRKRSNTAPAIDGRVDQVSAALTSGNMNERHNLARIFMH